MNQQDLYDKLLYGIASHHDEGSKNLISYLSTDEFTRNLVSYECMIYKLYLLTIYTGNQPREGLSAVIAQECALIVPEMLGNTPDYWEKKVLDDVEYYTKEINSVIKPIDVMVDHMTILGSGIPLINYQYIVFADLSIGEIDMYMDRLIHEYKTKVNRLKKSPEKAVAGSGCMVSVLGLLMIFALSCIIF